jgi:hypothetical protein
MSASDIAAWWGAGIATLVLVWDIFKWKQTGPRLRLSVLPNMNVTGSVPNADPTKTYVLVEVVNIGDKKTELTYLVGLYYKSRLQRIRGKSDQNFAVINPAFSTKFPCFVVPGERWVGGIEQTQDLEEMSRTGFLYFGVFHSAGKKALTKRVVVSAKAD